MTQVVGQHSGYRREPLPPGGCCVTIGDWDDATACTGTATTRLTVGCAHEHLFNQPVCTSHPELLKTPVGKQLGTCRACYDVDGHTCPMTLLRREPLPLAATGR